MKKKPVKKSSKLYLPKAKPKLCTNTNVQWDHKEKEFLIRPPRMDQSISTTNLERWEYYMRDVTSPTMYITLGFYFMIAAALQRRVYLGSDERPLFPNLYIILVGEPGVGKGLVIKPVTEFLKHHKLRRFKLKKDKPLTGDDATANLDVMKAMLEEFNATNGLNIDPAMLATMTGQEQPAQGNSKSTQRKLPEDPLLIPMTADAITYEALVRAHANSLRSIGTTDKSRLVVNGYYSHSSLCISLEELSSMLRKHTQDVVNYLLRGYDCGDYVYETRTQGISKVKSMCLNMLGGTTPTFMKSAFTDELLSEGFSSRTIFCYAPENRFERFEVSRMSSEQLAAKDAILAHIERLSVLFGQVTYTPEAYDFMKNYIEVELKEHRKRCPAKLLHYYARKNITIQKLAMAHHFAESTEMVIQLESCHFAVKLSAEVEKTMETALETGGRNPLAPATNKIYRAVKMAGPYTFTQLWGMFVDSVNEQELGEILKFLQATGKIKMLEKDNIQKYYGC